MVTAAGGDCTRMAHDGNTDTATYIQVGDMLQHHLGYTVLGYLSK